MTNKINKILCILAVGAFFGAAQAADEHAHHQSVGHVHITSEPIGVMGAHAHATGDWMFSYRAMRMDMEGNRSGSDRLSTADVLGQGFAIVPLRMTMDMHMLGVMYGISDDLTIMAMVPYLDIDMDHITGMGASFTTEASGLGDVKLSGLYRLAQLDHHTFNLNVGISVPTGSIDERDATPMGPNQPLPYPMQLGSGTWDLLPGVTYTGHLDDLDWGAQAAAVLRLGENDNDYTLGNRFRLSSWISKSWTPVFSSSLRLDADWWGNIDGADSNLSAMAPMMVPTADPDRRGGRRYDLLVGASIAPTGGVLAGHRFSVEFGLPVYQNLDGPQLETDRTVTLGWQLAI